MPGPRTFFDEWAMGRAYFIGLGNPDLGDDGFGVHLAEELIRAGAPNVVVAGTTPENFLGPVIDGGFADLVFLDVVDFGAEPGTVMLADSLEIRARFPQISTHKISLAALAQLVESSCGTRVWLLGVQPGSLRPQQVFSAAVEKTLGTVKELLLHRGPRDARDTEREVDVGVHAC